MRRPMLPGARQATGVAAQPKAPAARDPWAGSRLAASRRPIQSSFCRSCCHRREARCPFTSNQRSFLCPAHTWPTETQPFAPPSKRRRIVGEVLALNVKRLSALVLPPCGERFRGARGLQRGRNHRGQVGEHGVDALAGDMLRRGRTSASRCRRRPSSAPPLSGSRRHEKSVGSSSQSCR